MNDIVKALFKGEEEMIDGWVEENTLIESPTTFVEIINNGTKTRYFKIEVDLNLDIVSINEMYR